jgi:Icc-related predicted phosphoesterase
MAVHCFFVSDLHGSHRRYAKLFAAIEKEKPHAVFVGGDILPGLAGHESAAGTAQNFIEDYLLPRLTKLQTKMQTRFPRIFIILGNDDPRCHESEIEKLAARNLLEYIHNRHVNIGDYDVYGYAYVVPTPFLLKDWERYDVSRYVDPGCVSPEAGYRSVAVSAFEKRYTTIAKDLDQLSNANDQRRAVWLFHCPPYDTALDRAALDGQSVDHAPLDVHVGSIAIRRFIEHKKPYLTLHGHIHESTRLTGAFRQRIGETVCLSAAHDGPQLALVRFTLGQRTQASRALL